MQYSFEDITKAFCEAYQNLTPIINPKSKPFMVENNPLRNSKLYMWNLGFHVAPSFLSSTLFSVRFYINTQRLTARVGGKEINIKISEIEKAMQDQFAYKGALLNIE